MHRDHELHLLETLALFLFGTTVCTSWPEAWAAAEALLPDLLAYAADWDATVAAMQEATQ